MNERKKTWLLISKLVLEFYVKIIMGIFVLFGIFWGCVTKGFEAGNNFITDFIDKNIKGD